MKQFSKLLAALVMFVMVSAAFTCLALKTGSNGFDGPTYDIRAFGAVCDGGTTSDSAAFNRAYTYLTGLGGGTIWVPGGKTCGIGSDVQVESNVSLQCDAGGTLKATASPTFTLGMFSWFNGAVNRNNSSVDGCTFDLNTKAVAAVFVAGTRNSFTRNRFINGSVSNGSGWNMVTYSCTGEQCNFNNNVITCGNASGAAKDTGLNISSSSTAGEQANVSGNIIKACDTAAISVSGSGVVNVIGNGITTVGASAVGITGGVSGTVNLNQITTSGASAVAIDLAGAYCSADGNTITMSGNSAYGIKLTSAHTTATGNAVIASGTGAIAFRTYNVYHKVQGNFYDFSAASGGAVGIYVGDGGTLDGQVSVIGNIGGISGTTDTQTHVMIANPMVNVTGNLFTKGKYCVAPSTASVAEIADAFNVEVESNRCYLQGDTAIVATTGFEILGNYLAWLASTGTAIIQIGDTRSIYKIGTSHTNITGNIIHTQEAGIPGIKVNDIQETCNSGTNQFQTCTADNLTQCPLATASCAGANSDCCAQGLNTGVQINANHFLLGITGSGAAVDFSSAISNSTSAVVKDYVINGNTFDGAVSGSWVAVKCPSSNQTRMTRVENGINSYTGYTPVTGDTSGKGRLDLNCTPDMVNDAMTSMVWMPAAGCNGTTAFPIYDMPTSSAPTAVCSGSTYNRGFLSYANAVDTGAYTNLMMDAAGAHQFFIRPLFITGSATTTSTRWAFTATCVGDNAALDPSWTTSISEQTLDVAYENTANALRIPSAYSTLGGLACGNGMVSLRIRRIGTNNSGGQDDFTGSSLLYGVQMFVRRQD